jgi:hypothetical protein
MLSRTRTGSGLNHCRDPSTPHYFGQRITPVMLISALPVKLSTQSRDVVHPIGAKRRW